VISCPSRYLRDVCRRIRSEAGEGARNLRSVVLLTKGLEPDSNEVATQVASEELPGLAVTLLSGPTFASQVAAGKPSAIVLAGDCAAETLRELQAAMSGPTPAQLHERATWRGVATGAASRTSTRSPPAAATAWDWATTPRPPC
jgi:glycerol-3-phosphate dehydrogenase (NAD(P)+)